MMPETDKRPILYQRHEPIINERVGMPDWPLARWGERIVFPMGNCPQSDSKLWSACWETGERCDPSCWELTPLPFAEQPRMGAVVRRVAGWAHNGNADAAFWLGYWFEDIRREVAFWYYLASMRNDRRYRDLFDRVCCDLYGYVRPKIRRALGAGADVHEVAHGKFSTDWQAAIASAEEACAFEIR